MAESSTGMLEISGKCFKCGAVQFLGLTHHCLTGGALVIPISWLDAQDLLKENDFLRYENGWLKRDLQFAEQIMRTTNA